MCNKRINSFTSKSDTLQRICLGALTDLVNEIEVFETFAKDSNQTDSSAYESSKNDILKYFDNLIEAEQEVAREYRWATSDKEKLLDFDEKVVAIRQQFNRCIINHEKYFIVKMKIKAQKN